MSACMKKAKPCQILYVNAFISCLSVFASADTKLEPKKLSKVCLV